MTRRQAHDFFIITCGKPREKQRKDKIYESDRTPMKLNWKKSKHTQKEYKIKICKLDRQLTIKK